MTSILLIGSGEIAHHYVVALRQLGYFHIDVLSRTIEGSTKFGKPMNYIIASEVEYLLYPQS